MRTLSRWIWFVAFECPGEDESQRVQVTIGKNRVSKIGPAVAHEIIAFFKIDGSFRDLRHTEAARFVINYYKCDVLKI